MRDLRHVVLILLVGLWPAVAAAGIDEGDVRRSLARQGFAVDHVQMRPGADIVVQAHRKGRPVTLVFDAQRGVLLSRHEGATPAAPPDSVALPGRGAEGRQQRQHASRGTLGSGEDDEDHRPGKGAIGRTPSGTANDAADSPEDSNPDPADDLGDIDDGWDDLEDPDDDSLGESDGDGTWDDDDVGDTPGDGADDAFGDDEAKDGDDTAGDDDAGGWDDTEDGSETDEDGADATDDDA